MDAAPYDLALVQGATYERSFRWKEGDVVQPLAGYTVKAQVRQKEDTSAQLLLDLGPYLTVANDTINLRIPATVTALLNPKLFRKAAWDLFLIETADPTEAFPLLAGAATCDPAATQTVEV